MASDTKELGRRYLGLLLDGRYRLNELIGWGGMGAVFRAMDERLRREVAVKVIHVGDLDGDELVRHRQRFSREGQLAARISHPNVVSIFDSGTYVEPQSGHELDYIVMELIRGGSLAEWLPRLSRTDFALPFSLLMQTAQGVAAGHREGVVHRDVKPRNVLVVPAGEPGRLWARVVDFGIARPLHDDGAFGEITVGPGFMGTASYASPEQLVGRTAPGPESDVFSLGLVGFELFTGSLPFTEGERARLSQGLHVPACPPRRVNPAVPPAIDEVLSRALAIDPLQRFANADAFAVALEAAWRRAEAAAPLPEPDTTVRVEDRTEALPSTEVIALLPALHTEPAHERPVAQTQPALDPVPPPRLGPDVEPFAVPAQLVGDVDPSAAAPPADETQPSTTERRLSSPSTSPARRRRRRLRYGQPSRLALLGRRAAVWVPATALVATIVASVVNGGVPGGAALATFFDLGRWSTPLLVAGEAVTGEIDRGERTSDGLARYEVYRYEAAEGGPVVATLRASGFQGALEWGRTVDREWQVLERSEPGRDAELRVAVEPGGKYQLRVRSRAAADTGSYTLTVTPGAPRIEPGDEIESTLTAADARVADGEYAEQWAYRGIPGRQVTVALNSGATARLEWGRVVGGEWMLYEAGGEGESRLTVTAADSGEYVVRVRKLQPATEQTPYTLSMVAGAREIRPGVSQRGRLSRADAGLDGAAYELWKYRGAPFEQVTFTARGSDSARAQLQLGHLVGGRWQVLESSVAGAGAREAQLTAALDTGAYLIRATTDLQAGDGGRYELTARTGPQRIGLGQTRRSTLSSVDLVNDYNRYYETWTYRGSAGQLVWISVQGSGSDRYYLGFTRYENGAWRVYGSSGDAPLSNSSAYMLVTVPDDREYTIVVLKETSMPETYSLQVRQF